MRRGPAGVLAASVAVADQMVASAAAVITVVLAARALEVGDFSWFALIFASLALIVGAVRAWFGEPALILIEPHERERRELALSSALRLWLAAGVAVAVAIAVAGTPSTAIGSATVLIVGLGVFDSARFWLVGSGRPAWSLLVSLSATVCAVAGMAHVEPSSLALVMQVLGFSLGGVSTVVAAGAVASVWRRPNRAAEHARWAACAVRRGHARRFTSEFMLGNGGYYLGTVLATAAIDVRAAAGIRGSESLLGPVRVLISILPNAVLASIDRGSLSSVRTAVMISAGTASVAVVGYLVAVGAVQQFGPSLFGESASVVAAVLPFLGVAPILQAGASGPVIALRARQRSDLTVRVRGVVAIFPAAGVAIGMWGGLAGIGLGLALASGAACCLWWLALLRETSGD